MEFIIGLVLFTLFAIGFARMDANLIKISKSVEKIEKDLSKKGKN
jgi:hypothetical protein